MAAICFGPPPLPPNKKSCRHNRNNTTNNNKNHLLSSTYHSFRDPAEDSEIIVMKIIDSNEENNNKKNGGRDNNNKCRRVSHTNSLKRDKDVKFSLVRSHSEGNLHKKSGSSVSTPMTINKYIKVLSGSWKNLLNCK